MKRNNLMFEIWPKPKEGGMLLGIPKGIKVTHLPTGLVAICDTERDQYKNRNLALAALSALVAKSKRERACII